MKEKPILIVIGNSNVGKSTICKKLLPNSFDFKGKTGKHPGSTLLIRSIRSNLPYDIVDLPGFGFMKSPSRRREEHIKKQMVKFLEKNAHTIFYALVVINILRIEDELNKYYLKNTKTIPLSLEILDFLIELEIKFLIVLNKIDKISQYDRKKIIQFYLDIANSYGYLVKSIHETNNVLDICDYRRKMVPLIQTSALKGKNIDIVKKAIKINLEEYLIRVKGC